MTVTPQISGRAAVPALVLGLGPMPMFGRVAGGSRSGGVAVARTFGRPAGRSLLRHLAGPSPLPHLAGPSPLGHVARRSPLRHLAGPSPLGHVARGSLFRRVLEFVPVALALISVLGACSPTAASLPPTAAPSAPPVAQSATAVAAVTASPRTAPSLASAAAPTATGAGASLGGCAVVPQNGALPSDRLVSLQVQDLGDRDVIRFEFGNASLAPSGPPTGSLDVAVPPFTEGASGLPIEVVGDQALLMILRGMSLQNDVGQPTFTGPREVRASALASSVRHVILFDESEGQLGFYIGYDGAGCVTLTREGMTVLLTIAHRPA